MNVISLTLPCNKNYQDYWYKSHFRSCKLILVKIINTSFRAIISVLMKTANFALEQILATLDQERAKKVGVAWFGVQLQLIFFRHFLLPWIRIKEMVIQIFLWFRWKHSNYCENLNMIGVQGGSCCFA